MSSFAEPIAFQPGAELLEERARRGKCLKSLGAGAVPGEVERQQVDFIEEAAEALEVTSKCGIDGQPLIVPYKNVWLLSSAARDAVLGSKSDEIHLRRLGVLWYVAPEAESVREIVEAWLRVHDRITSGDYAAMTGFTNAGARRALERLLGDILQRGDATGRNAHFRAIQV